MGKKRGGGAVRVKQVGPKMPPQMPTMEDFAIAPDEVIHLPPPPDRSYQVIWPIHETFSLKTDGFQVIYPSYLDANKTIQQGRRIAKENAVPMPTCADLSQALQMLQIRHVLQPYKGYSRDVTCLWDNPGRVLVDTKGANKTKNELMRDVANKIPNLPDRLVRLQREAQEAAAVEEKRAAAAALKAKEKAQQAANKKAAATTGSTKKGKKKGKK